MNRVFITVDEAKTKLGLIDNPMIDELVGSANSLIDDYVDELISTDNSLARLGVLKYIEFLNLKRAGIKSITDIDMSLTYDETSFNSLPPFISELLLPIKKSVKSKSGFKFL